MITSIKKTLMGSKVLCEFFGLSTDEKPSMLDRRSVANGSAYLEMDTGDLYLYDESGSEWLKQ